MMIGLAALFTSDEDGGMMVVSVKVLSTVIDLWSWEENVLDDTKRAMLDHCLGTRVHQTY